MGSTTLALVGRYRLEDRIAAGGVGEVWRGRDMVLDRAVAVKLLRPDYVQHPETLARFRAEARHAAGVSHPGIAQVYDYGEDGQPFLVMELVPGPSLAGVLLERGPLDAGTAMDVAALITSLTAKEPQARPATAAAAASWAAQLRDSQAPFAAARRAGGDGPATETLTDAVPGTLVGAPSQVMADAQVGPQPAHRTPLARGLHRGRTLALAAGVVAIIAGLAGWLLAGGPGADHPGQRQAGPARVSTSPTTPRLAQVSQATLAGQPVSAVRRQLRQLGLQVQVIWRHNGHQQPGTVIAVQPTGRLPAGTTVTLTGALAPPGHRGHGNGGDDQGNGQGD
jgi:hypothetical protein